MRSQKEKLQSPEGSKILPRIGHICLSIFTFDYTEMWTSTMHFTKSLMILYIIGGGEDVKLVINTNHSQSWHPSQERFPAACHRTLSLPHLAEHFHMKLNKDSNNNKGIPIKSWGFPSSSEGKAFACNAGGLGLIPGEGNGYPFHYSYLENSMDRAVLWATVHGVANSWTQMSNSLSHTHTHTHTILRCHRAEKGIRYIKTREVWQVLRGG